MWIKTADLRKHPEPAITPNLLNLDQVSAVEIVYAPGQDPKEHRYNVVATTPNGVEACVCPKPLLLDDARDMVNEIYSNLRMGNRFLDITHYATKEDG